MGWSPGKKQGNANEREIWKLASLADKHEQQRPCVEMTHSSESDLIQHKHTLLVSSSFIFAHSSDTFTVCPAGLYGNVAAVLETSFLWLWPFCVTALIFTQT